MSDTNVIEQTPWADRQLSDAQMRNREAAAQLPVTSTGANPMTFAQEADYCTWMSNSGPAVPGHLHRNTGACIAVFEMARKWDFPPYQVARQTYVVNGVMAWQGALIMAVINKFAPLKERLRFSFSGDGDQRVVHVTGHFKGEAEPVVYTSPPLAVFRGTGKSPLWKADPDQQMIYLASRRWQLRYWPEGLFGIYSPEEMEDPDFAKHVGAGNAKDVTPATTLIDRLKSAQQQEGETMVDQTDPQGFSEANVNSELDQVQQNGKPDATETKARAEALGDAKKRERKGKKADAPKDELGGPVSDGGDANATALNERAAELEKAPPKLEELPKPKTAKDWAAYNLRWIEIGEGDLMKRWRAEMNLRNGLGITEDDRGPVFEKLTERIAVLEGRDQ